MSSGTQYPPTERRVRVLRRDGSIPWSMHVQHASCCLAAVLFVVTLLYQVDGRLASFATAMWGRTAGDDALAAMQSVFTGLALMVALPIAAVVLVGGLLQSRFLLRLQALGLAFQRPFSLVANIGRSLRIGRAELLRQLFSLLVIVGVSAVCIPEMFRRSQELLQPWQQANQAAFVEQFVASLLPIVVGLAVVLLLLAVFGRMWAVFSFRRAHAMSREELIAEWRETEGSSVVRDALREEARREEPETVPADSDSDRE